MEKELYEYFTTDNKSGKKSNEKWISKNNESIYKIIINWCNLQPDLKNIEFKRKVYHYINKQTHIPSCKECGNEVKYKRLVDGYSEYCSDKCVKVSEDYHKKWKETWKKNNSDGKFIDKRNETLTEKYGSTFNNFIKEKRKQSNLKKYGVENVFQIDKIKKRRKETLKQKYGSENFNNTDKTRTTRIYNQTQIDDEKIDSFIDYKKIVTNRTNTIYRNNKKNINPKDLTRSIKQYHLDHIYSIKQGFLNNLPLSIITHPCNLHLIHYKVNLKKQDNCWISIEELLNRIINYNENIEIKQTKMREDYNSTKQIAQLLLNSLNNIS